MIKISDLFNPVLSDRTIVKYIQKGQLFESLIPYENIQPNSVDLTLSNSCKYILSNTYENPSSEFETTIKQWDCAHNAIDPHSIIDTAKPMKYTSDTIGDDGIIIKPNEFVLLASNEILNIPNGIVGFVQGRSSIARIGMQTEEAGLVDSGFRGTITFEVYNETPYSIRIYKGMRVAQIYFIKSQRSSRLYGKDHGSKYRDQIEATGSKIFEDPEVRRHAK